MTNNTTWHETSVSHEERARQKQHRPALIWYTGLSGAGKSTIANEVDRKLFELGCHTYLLDGDNLRHGLNKDLGFNDIDRVENLRRTSEVCRLLLDAGLILSTAFISPFLSDRENIRRLIGKSFIEVFVDTPLEVCIQRDPKGLYKKAQTGTISQFTGISSAYEAPQDPEIHLKPEEMDLEQLTEKVVQYVIDGGFIYGGRS
ncbi:adenylyl-sulfate kinase [Idiomarina sp.]|uniref:adenylyl-sulfate kinase n=1 Tax=Idiomarina sp. TaxID=1874361 RepID=UPI00258DC036|nr:adenylyl-sulfate kinase [Idiomarina sp.]